MKIRSNLIAWAIIAGILVLPNLIFAHPYLFWINNDHDGYGSESGVQDDLDPATGKDSDSPTITCTRDLEDFTRLWIKTEGISQEIQNGTFLIALQWENVTAGNPQIKIFPAAETNGGTLYLTDTNAAQQQITAPYNTEIVDLNGREIVSPTAPFIIPTNVWIAAASNNPSVAHFLFEGVKTGSGKLVIAILKKDGVTKLGESGALYMDLRDVKEMYERWTVGNDPSVAPTTTASIIPPTEYTADDPEDKTYILFVHGWNLAPWEQTAFAETAFKRLWWQGYKGRFGVFEWPTGYGISGGISAALHARNFDNSESNAWASAPALAGLLNNLNVQYPNQVYMFAHSMGNVVAGEALKLLGTNQVVNTYIACQAAISAHGYDPSTATWTSGSTPDIYANYWTNNAPCYFDSIASVSSRANYYNAQDYALNKWITDQYWKPDHGVSYPGYFYSTPSSTHPSGFYKIAGTGPDIDLFFPANNYEILAYCVQSRSYCLGATPNVNGFTPQNLRDLWPSDPFEDNQDDWYKDHPWHSAEFRFDNVAQQNFWKTLLGQDGFKLK
jgi:hypothetical protein